MERKQRACIALVTSLLITSAMAKGFVPAIVYDQAGKLDKSFNEAAATGAERFKKEFHITVRESQISSDAQKGQLLRIIARKAPDLVVAVGFAFTEAVKTVSREFPQVKFTLVDAATDGPNVQSIVFKDQEGAFLVGMVAAMVSKTGIVGFIGAMDIPLLRAFHCGYVQGVRYINKNHSVILNTIGSTPKAFNDPVRAAELAKSQFARGADVIFVAAGGASVGVLQAAKSAGKLAIGVDANQNASYPGVVLTSMVKRVDKVVYDTLRDAKNGDWKPVMKTVGLEEQGIDWALDQHNRKMISVSMENKVNAAKKDIISRKIKVVDYRTKHRCSVQ